MPVTTILVTTAAIAVWKWPVGIVAPVAALFFALDTTLPRTPTRFPKGQVSVDGRSHRAVSRRRGPEIALARRDADAIPLRTFLDGLSGPHPPMRVPGTAIYFTTRHDVVPAALSLNLKHNGA